MTSSRGAAGPSGNEGRQENAARRTARPANGNGRAHEQAQPSNPPLPGPPPQSPLSAEELEQFRRLLIEQRRQMADDLDHMANEALGKNRADACGDLSLMPIHMADIGSDNYEQEFTISLMQNERTTLKEIDEALARIDAGTYGVCLATHKPIAKARLLARPWARFCVEYMRAQEQSRKR